MENSQARVGLEKTYFTISGLYVFIYYGFGALYPLLSQYYKSIGLSGTQIGTISSITPLISIIAQPIWGMICDKYQIRKLILVVTLLISALTSLLFTMITSYAWVLVLFLVVSLFQCAIVPISDSLALTYANKKNMQFGNLRLWGAVGFAIAVFFTGLAIGKWNSHVIFYFYAAAFVLSIFFVRGIPDEGTSMNASLFEGLGQLLALPRFVLFLISSFFIFGAINANNVWFSLYYEHIGGSVAGIGVAFLLFAGSEAPFMKVATFFVRKWGLELTVLFAGTVSALRWFWYGTAPDTTIILSLFFLQGVSVGFYLATAAQFVRENTPSSLQVTALAIFASIGHGLGTMTCHFFAGVIMDKAGILMTYTFLGVFTSLGLLPLIFIRFGPFKKMTPFL